LEVEIYTLSPTKILAGDIMKTLIFILVVLNFFVVKINAQWVAQNSGTSNTLQSVYFLNSELGWAAGDDGTVLKTTDGGSTWVVHNIGTLDHIHVIFFSNPLEGWAVLSEYVPARHGSVIHTTDGGNSWNAQLIIFDYLLHSIHFSDENNGWVVGSNGITFHTTNAGVTWIQQYPNPQFGWLWPVFFLDNNIGWTAGDALFGMSKTTDGGSNWSSTNLPVVEIVYSIIFADSLIGWLSGSQGQIAKSVDGGITWQTVPSGTSQFLRDIYFIDYNNGWSVGYNGTIIHSTDAGQSWEYQSSGTSSELFSVQFLDDQTGWIVGRNGVILKYDGDLSLIDLISPNGGEILTAGSTYFIEWTSQNVIDIKIEYSTDNGNNWIAIVDSFSSTGIYEWIIPNTLTTEGRVRISDATDPSVFDISDGSFTIQTSRVVTVLDPNGGEIIDGGSQYEILWNSNDVEYVKLEYSINNGASWSTIADSTQSSGIFVWNVPNVLTTQARVKISDLDFPSVSDISDEPFRINYIVNVNDNKGITEFDLKQNFPNPFNPTTKIEYQIPELSFVTIKLYDVLGNEIETLVNEEKLTGTYEVEFDASELSSGIYCYKIVAGDFVDVKKMLLVK